MNGIYNGVYGMNFPQYQPPYQPYQQYRQEYRPTGNPSNTGRMLFVNSYNEVANAPLPSDGSMTLFMLNNDPTFYIAYMQGGKPFIQGFSFTPLGASEQQTSKPQASNENDFESRLKKLENFQKEIMDMLGGSGNESNIPAQNQPKQRK